MRNSLFDLIYKVCVCVLLNTSDSDELNVIQHSPYFSDDDLLQSSIHTSNGLSILSLNSQSLRAKFDYIKLLTEKFAASNCSLQVLCLQESWFSSETDLSSYVIPGYHMISSGHYASTHGGLVIYLHEKWSYRIKNYETKSQIWENQIIEICDPTYSNSQGIIIGNICLPPYNSRDNYATFTREFNALLLEYHSKRYNTYMCADYNIDLLKVNKVHSYVMYFNNILSAGYILTITLPTRLSTSSTLIDNIFTTNISKEVKASILNVHISDHQPIFLFIDEKAPVSTCKSKYITITTNSEQAKAAFCLYFGNQQVLQKLDADTVDLFLSEQESLSSRFHLLSLCLV